MIESYLRANKMFVDYNEVSFMNVFDFKSTSLFLAKNLCVGSSPKWREHTPLIWNWILRMWNHVFRVPKGNPQWIQYCCHEVGLVLPPHPSIG